MTRDEIHRLALRAAAKVTAGLRRYSAGAAFGLALAGASLGCGSSSDTGTAAGGDTGAITAADTTVDIEGWLDSYVAGNDTAIEDAGSTPDTATSEDTAAAVDTAVTEDVAPTEDMATHDDAGSPEDVAIDAGSPEDVTAAGDTVTFADIGDGLVSCVLPDGQMDWQCCEAQGWEPSPQCTPWGPPAPPAYRGERLV